ncbi:hypothetical protein ACH5RR_032390 [Cinchona calisaya]|uniref:Uncharacterized protein n=1 Tax=Cinchona calisaya TaxID=153742 RepID=A0ABD2YJ19_9GENT
MLTEMQRELMLLYLGDSEEAAKFFDAQLKDDQNEVLSQGDSNSDIELNLDSFPSDLALGSKTNQNLVINDAIVSQPAMVCTSSLNLAIQEISFSLALALVSNDNVQGSIPAMDILVKDKQIRIKEAETAVKETNEDNVALGTFPCQPLTLSLNKEIPLIPISVSSAPSIQDPPAKVQVESSDDDAKEVTVRDNYVATVP